MRLVNKSRLRDPGERFRVGLGSTNRVEYARDPVIDKPNYRNHLQKAENSVDCVRYD